MFMSTVKKAEKQAEDLQSILQMLIAQGRKEGMIKASDLNAHLEKSRKNRRNLRSV